LLRAIVQQKTTLLRVEARGATGGRTCTEDGNSAVRAPMGEGLNAQQCRFLLDYSA
jgi:hypothetical protein